MNGFGDAIAAVEMQRKTLELYSAEADVSTDIVGQFSTRNVRVTSHTLPPRGDRGFLIVRGPDGEFRGAMGIDHLQAVVSPEIHPPWPLGDPDASESDLLDFLDNTVFTSYDRRQLLAITREIEERAWRANAGRLYVGFQRFEAFTAQAPVYDRFARDSDVSVRIFVGDGWEAEIDDSVEVVSEAGEEIGQFWFVLFVDDERELNTCGVIAEERTPGQYYGFWTHDIERIDAIVSYLDTAYGRG